MAAGNRWRSCRQPALTEARMLVTPNNDLDELALDIGALLPEELVELDALIRRPADRWCPHRPTERQQLFLSLTDLEAFYGGAVAGGKTDALLMAALQYVDYPGYSALLLMKTFSDLSKPGA